MQGHASRRTLQGLKIFYSMDSWGCFLFPSSGVVCKSEFRQGPALSIYIVQHWDYHIPSSLIGWKHKTYITDKRDPLAMQTVLIQTVTVEVEKRQSVNVKVKAQWATENNMRKSLKFTPFLLMMGFHPRYQPW